MLHQTLPILEQLWQLFEVSQILEFLRYTDIILGVVDGASCLSYKWVNNKCVGHSISGIYTLL